MPPSHHLRHLRRLSTTPSPTPLPPPTLTISQLKSKLRSEFDPDKALHLLTSSSSSTLLSSSPSSFHQALSLTIRRLSKSHRPLDIHSLLSSLQSTNPLSEPLLSSIIISYSLADMFDHSLQTFHQLDRLGVPRSVSSFNAILSASLNCKQFSRVPQMFDELSHKYSISPDTVSYGILVKSYCAVGLPDKAIAVIKESKEKGIEVSVVTYTTVLSSLYKKGDVDSGVEFWEEMVGTGCKLDAAAYNVRLINVQGAGPEEVSKILEEMFEAGIRPDTVSFNCLITAYCATRRMEEAMKVYEEELGGGSNYDRASKCRANAATYRTLVYHWCRIGEYEKGYKVFKESARENRIPDFGTVKGLVEGLVKQGKVKEAKGVIRTVKKKFPPNVVRAWRKVEEELGLVKDVESKDSEESREAVA